MLLLLGWYVHSVLMTRSFLTCDSQDKKATHRDLFSIICEESELDSSLYRVDCVRQSIPLFDDLTVDVHTAACKGFDTPVKSVPKDELEFLVVPLRRTIEGADPGGPGRTVTRFSLPKGVAPTVPIIIAGLTTGSNEQLENAAYAIGDLIERTDESAIKPFVAPFTGPLVRVATQPDRDPDRARCDAGENTEPHQAVFPAAAADVLSNPSVIRRAPSCVRALRVRSVC